MRSVRLNSSENLVSEKRMRTLSVKYARIESMLLDLGLANPCLSIHSVVIANVHQDDAFILDHKFDGDAI